MCQEVQEFQLLLQRNKTEKPQQNTMLDLIDEDCESGGTDKSVHFQQSIKKDMKKVKQVNFETLDKVVKEKSRPPQFSIKDIKLPSNLKTQKLSRH